MNSSPETCNNNTMKRILLAACLLMTVACNSKTSTAMQTTTEPVFGLGVPVSDNFTGEAWLRTLSAEPGYDCQIYNVTFAPSTRNYWHRHAVGQILLCTEGIGFYQEQGAPARRLIPGDVVNIQGRFIGTVRRRTAVSHISGLLRKRVETKSNGSVK